MAERPTHVDSVKLCPGTENQCCANRRAAGPAQKGDFKRLCAKNNEIRLRAKDLSPVIEKLKGYSAAELESVVLHSRWFARRDGRAVVTLDDLLAAADDYIPSRNDKMIEYMELLAILESSSRRRWPRRCAAVVP